LLFAIESGMDPWSIDLYLATSEQVFNPESKLRAIRQLQSMNSTT